MLVCDILQCEQETEVAFSSGKLLSIVIPNCSRRVYYERTMDSNLKRARWCVLYFPGSVF